jgi:hypothetical protein
MVVQVVSKTRLEICPFAALPWQAMCNLGSMHWTTLVWVSI